MLQTVLGSSAGVKFREGRKGDLNFADACRFWNITEHLAVPVLDQRLHTLGNSVHAIERQLSQTGATLSGGRFLSTNEAAQLAELHDYLEDRFERHLMLLRNRAERR